MARHGGRRRGGGESQTRGLRSFPSLHTRLSRHVWPGPFFVQEDPAWIPVSSGDGGGLEGRNPGLSGERRSGVVSGTS